jgi:decaprenylphospho-beta-D-ribofuranose 2-oxidase
MNITNWGNYPFIDARIFSPADDNGIKECILASEELIPRGLGRCYGDSSLNTTIISMLRMNHFLAFDDVNGILTCEAGVSLEEILDVCVPRGWFLSVTPGTKYVTVGGAIASDVHGKNHHVAGSFSRHVVSIKVMVSDGTVVKCSNTEHQDLFWSTCGGMGLTGVILEATIQLLKIETAYIRQRIVKSKNIDEAIDLFETNNHWTYSVAWIDCLAKGNSLGRSALILGEHATRDEVGYRYRNPLSVDKKRPIPVPFFFPNFMLNTYTVKLFNELRYATYFAKDSVAEYESFFYPLDSIAHWNKIYGKRGFTQYQFVLPKESSREGMKKILTRIAQSGEGSFLAVLKLFGQQSGILSFPREGFTLALDFPITPTTLTLFCELDAMVVDFGGRMYLSKDVRMSKELFDRGYSSAAQFREIKKQFDPLMKFRSLQSKRIGV